MSYLLTEDSHVGLEADILTPYSLSGSSWLLDTPATFNTDISVSGSTITLYSGSSYYIEASVTGACFGGSGTMTWQLYNATASSLIGQDAYFSMGNWGDRARVGRKVAKALILDSDINTSMDIQVQQTSLTGSSWSFTVTLGVGIDNRYTHQGYPSVRIWQLPS